MPLTIAICDDNEDQIKELRRSLDEWSAYKPFALTIDEYISAESFLFSYPDKICDLLLLDIEMKKLNGMELAKRLRSDGDMLPIVFITGYITIKTTNTLNFENISGTVRNELRRSYLHLCVRVMI